MKKVVLTLIAVSTLALVACGPSKTFKALDEATKAATTKLEAVTTLEEVAAIQTEWNDAVAKAKTENGELKADSKEVAQFAEASKVMVELAVKKTDSLNQVAVAAAQAAAAAQASADSLANATKK